MTSHSIAAVGERGLVERLRHRAGAPPAWVVLGIGDDAAVIEPARNQLDVLTADSLIEDVHFRLNWTSARAVGRKALAVNLSDLAAMGAAPRAVLLSLALPSTFELAAFDALVDGFVTLADHVRVPLVGGNLTRSPGPLVVDVTALGTGRHRRLLTRRGGRPADELYLTGSVGAAAAGLGMLQAGTDRARLDAHAAACVTRYEEPDARLECGIQVARNRAASACVDLSDGLADAARQLAQASRTGVVIDAEAVPIHPGALDWAASLGREALRFGLSGGEDYELLFSVQRKQRRAFLATTARCPDVTLTRVGRLTAEPGEWLDRGGRLEPLGDGFSHF